MVTIFYFNTKSECATFIRHAIEIATTYGVVTLAELHDLVGEGSTYTDSRVFFTLDSLNSAEVHDRDPYKEKYSVVIPEPKICPPHPSTKPKETPTPEPLNITIIMDADPLKDPYTTIREVLTEANKIKDRPVFITIN